MMGIAPICGLRGDLLENPRRTEGIAAVRLQVAAVGSEGRDGSSSRQHAPDSGPDYEDAEFIEIPEEDERVTVTPRKGGHVDFVA